jgi:hypothetical protein
MTMSPWRFSFTLHRMGDRAKSSSASSAIFEAGRPRAARPATESASFRGTAAFSKWASHRSRSAEDSIRMVRRRVAVAMRRWKGATVSSKSPTSSFGSRCGRGRHEYHAQGK